MQLNKIKKMKTLRESILDDEDEVMNRMSLEKMFDDWMDQHSQDNSLWLDKDSKRWKNRWIKLKDGYKFDSVLIIDLGDDNTIPSYINFDGLKQLSIYTNAETLNINSKYLKNIKSLEIFGSNLSEIHIITNINTESMSITGKNLKVLDATKCQTDQLYLQKNKNLNLFKSHLPKHNRIQIAEEVKQTIYNYVKKQIGIDLSHTTIV